MNRRATYYGLMVACVLAAADLSAQKYPERRTTRRGTVLYGNGDFSGAESQYRRALELNPELREAAFNLGGALWRQAQSAAQAAAPDASQGAAQGAAPGAPGAQTEQQQAIQKWAQEATEVWMGIAADSLAPAPMASAASYNAGNVALSAQQLDAAIEAYKGALRLAPDDMEAKFNLAYAQKLKQQQDQNNDQNKDDQDGGNDQNDQNDDQNGENDQNDRNDDGQNDPQNGDGDRNDDGNGDQDGDGQDGDGPPPSGEGNGSPKMDPRAAEQMLDAMQAAEDDTREKVNAREVQVGSRSGKNW